MNAELNRSLLKWNRPLFWFTFLVPAAIIGLGINFIVNPVGASAGFGIPMTDPSAFPFMWIKGIRDIFAGVAVLTLLLRGDRRTIAIIYAISVFIAIGDGFVILRQLGFAPPIFMHWGTATYMAMVAILLHRKDKS
jgi:hypothetical protein